MAGERFLVTGAGGCIGAWVLRLLLDEGVAVVATDLSRDLRRFELVSYPRGGDKVDFVALDVTMGDEVADIVREGEVTHVVHLAGLQVPFCAADPAHGAVVNVVGTDNVFEAVRKANRPVGLSYASSGRFSEIAPCTQGAWSRTRLQPYPLPITASTRWPTKAQRVSTP
jgi:nucleoside-diphosphate-sugar epimerase